MSGEQTLALELTALELRALWRYASMCHEAFGEAFHRGGPVAIDSALAKCEIALMAAGLEVS